MRDYNVILENPPMFTFLNFFEVLPKYLGS